MIILWKIHVYKLMAYYKYVVMDEASSRIAL